MLKNKVSFDFDSTLEKPHIQEYAKELLSKGYDVYIVTTRYSDEKLAEKFGFQSCKNNNDLFDIAKKIGITNIIFTNMTDKWNYFCNHSDFLWHLDDDVVEIKFLNKKTKVLGLSSRGSSWKSKCERFLKKRLVS